MNTFEPDALPGATHLLFKAQQELAALLDVLPLSQRDALDAGLSLTLGGLHAALYGGGLPHGQARLCLTEGPRTAELMVRAIGAAPQVYAVMLDRNTSKRVEMSGQQIFQQEVPLEFQSLHRALKDCLQKQVPASFWKPLNTAATPSSEAAPEQQAGAQAATADTPKQAEQPGEPQMPVVVVPLIDEPDLRFRGRLLHVVRSGSFLGRWTELRAYQTQGGQFVGVEIGNSLRPGEVTRTRAQVSQKREDLAEFFGSKPHGKRMCDALGITKYQDID